MHTYRLCHVFAPEFFVSFQYNESCDQVVIQNVQKGKRNLHNLSIKFSCFVRFATLQFTNPALILDNKRNWERVMNERRFLFKSINKTSSIFLPFRLRGNEQPVTSESQAKAWSKFVSFQRLKNLIFVSQIFFFCNSRSLKERIILRKFQKSTACGKRSWLLKSKPLFSP